MNALHGAATASLSLVAWLWGALLYVLAAITALGLIELGMLTLAGAFPQRSKWRKSGAQLRLAVVVPAHNEEKLIARCVLSLAASAAASQAKVTVFVLADNCTDTTAETARTAGAEVLERHNDELRGKGYALEWAFEQVLALGFEGVLVVDADSTTSLSLIDEVTHALAGGAQAVQSRYQVLNSGDSPRTGLLALALLGFNVVRPRGRHSLGFSAGILGNGFAIESNTLRNIPYTAHSIVEDLEYHVKLVEHGIRVHFLDQATIYGEMPAAGKGVATQRSRWEGGRFLVARNTALPLIKQICRGHWRLIEPLLDLFTLPLAYLCSGLLALLVLGTPGLRWYAAGGVAIVAVHVMVAAASGNSFLSGLRALASAPFYLIWKLSMLPAMFRASRRNASWVRTERALAHEITTNN